MMTSKQPTKPAPVTQSKKYRAPQPPTTSELQNYESLATPKLSKKSKVKQVASTINSKIIKIVKNYTDVNKYSTLIKKFSFESKPQSKVSLAKSPTRPGYGYTKSEIPIPSPKIKSKVELEKNCTLTETEDVYLKMSVKDKVHYFNHLIENNDVPTKNNIISKITPPIPPPRKKRLARLSSTDSKVKHSQSEESETGLSPLLQIQAQNNGALTKPVRPLRKKKLQKNPNSKTNLTIKEVNTVNSTDSELEYKPSEHKLKGKQLVRLSLPTEVEAPYDLSAVEFDQSLMRAINSPRKIKSAYTLTASDLDTSLWKNTTSEYFCFPKVGNRDDENLTMKNKDKPKLKVSPNCSTAQGFETDSNNIAKISSIPENTKPYKIPESTFSFSTPIKHQLQKSFSSTNSAKKQLFSPITKPAKNGQISILNTKSHQGSLSMQVTKENKSLENHKDSSRNFSNTEQIFFANAPTLDMTANLTNANKSSKFWIKCADYSIALDINYIESERLHLLYEILSQTSCSTKDLHFGIDSHRFPVHNTNDVDNISTRLPAAVDGGSYYWFSTGGLDIPFSGKYLCSEKIQSLFRVLKLSIEEFGTLRFGVDEVIFSNVCEFWNESTNFFLDDNYSMLVGLQSGNSNGLEGRSKNAWPYMKPSMADVLKQSRYGKTDLEDYSDCDFSILNNEELSIPGHNKSATIL